MNQTDTMPAMNDENQHFYDRIDLDELKKLAEITSFAQCRDIEEVFPLIQHKSSVIELGAGYGRGIQKIIEKGYKGKLGAVERVGQFVEELRKIKGVEVFESDLRDFECTEKTGAFLWLWSGILEMSEEEQEAAVAKYARFLEPSGLLVIDIPFRKITVVGLQTDPQRLTLKESWGTLNAFLPFEPDIRRYAEKAGLEFLEPLRYSPKEGVERAVYVLRAAN